MVAAVASATVPVRDYTAPGAGVGSVHTTVMNNNVTNNISSKTSNVNSSSASSNCGNRIASSTSTLNVM